MTVCPSPARTCTRACSRPPEPTTRIFIGLNGAPRGEITRTG